MTERGLPIVDGAPACPFVAFADDRDERATSPDHRHRCYAEAQPAPRALAHQEAYCLSSAFPVCPTFQDWARREAARARPLDVPPGGSDDEDDLPPIVDDRPPRRTTPGTWAAPPPWLRGTPPGPGGGSAVSGAGAAAGSHHGPGPGRRDEPADQGEDAAAAGLAGAAGGGLAGSFADRLLGTAPGGAPQATPECRRGDAWDDEATDAAEEAAPDDEFDEADEAPPPPSRRGPAGAAGPGASARPGPRRPARERLDTGRTEDERERDAWAPAWERPRRLEAYPTLRSRRLSGLGLSPLLLAVLAVLLAGAALFFLPSLFIGSPGGGSPTPGVAASASPLASVEPTAEPAPTPFVYIVQAGDTMSKIAKKFGIPLGTLIAANATTVPNPDVLAVGDSVIIPSTLPTEIPGASAP